VRDLVYRVRGVGPTERDVMPAGGADSPLPGTAVRRVGGYLAWLALGSVLYGLLTRIADSVLVFVQAGEPVTPVWPPAGLALAGLLLLGYRFWPAIPLGHALAYLSMLDKPPLTLGPLCIAVAGNTAAALGTAYLLRRAVRFHPGLERLGDVLGLLVFGALLGGGVAATMGTTGLWLTGVIPAGAWGPVWRVWWIGDVLGILVAAPALLTWGTPPRPRLGVSRIQEAVALLLITVAVGLLVFRGAFGEPYAIFPVLVWAALRFGQRGAAVTMLVVLGMAVWYTTHGYGPFGGAVFSDSLVALQAFTGVVAVTVLILGATVSERQHAQAALVQANEELESRVVERTAQLSTAYDELQRLHEQELEYVREVDKVTGAAAAVETGAVVPDALTDVGRRTDRLGQLARVFGRMAQEVYARERRLREQVAQLRIEIDESKKTREVAEITETDYFQRLRERAQQLRNPGGT
jgi:integral membrane sensor domain MASE1